MQANVLFVSQNFFRCILFMSDCLRLKRLKETFAFSHIKRHQSQAAYSSISSRLRAYWGGFSVSFSFIDAIETKVLKLYKWDDNVMSSQLSRRFFAFWYSLVLNSGKWTRLILTVAYNINITHRDFNTGVNLSKILGEKTSIMGENGGNNRWKHRRF